MYFTSFVYDLVEIKGEGKIQEMPDPQKFSALRGKKNKVILVVYSAAGAKILVF